MSHFDWAATNPVSPLRSLPSLIAPISPLASVISSHSSTQPSAFNAESEPSSLPVQLTELSPSSIVAVSSSQPVTAATSAASASPSWGTSFAESPSAGSSLAPPLKGNNLFPPTSEPLPEAPSAGQNPSGSPRHSMAAVMPSPRGPHLHIPPRSFSLSAASSASAASAAASAAAPSPSCRAPPPSFLDPLPSPLITPLFASTTNPAAPPLPSPYGFSVAQPFGSLLFGSLPGTPAETPLDAATSALPAPRQMGSAGSGASEQPTGPSAALESSLPRAAAEAAAKASAAAIAHPSTAEAPAGTAPSLAAAPAAASAAPAQPLALSPVVALSPLTSAATFSFLPPGLGPSPNTAVTAPASAADVRVPEAATSAARAATACQPGYSDALVTPPVAGSNTAHPSAYAAPASSAAKDDGSPDALLMPPPLSIPSSRGTAALLAATAAPAAAGAPPPRPGAQEGANALPLGAAPSERDAAALPALSPATVEGFHLFRSMLALLETPRTADAAATAAYQCLARGRAPGQTGEGSGAERQRKEGQSVAGAAGETASASAMEVDRGGAAAAAPLTGSQTPVADADMADGPGAAPASSVAPALLAAAGPLSDASAPAAASAPLAAAPTAASPAPGAPMLSSPPLPSLQLPSASPVVSSSGAPLHSGPSRPLPSSTPPPSSSALPRKVSRASSSSSRRPKLSPVLVASPPAMGPAHSLPCTVRVHAVTGQTVQASNSPGGATRYSGNVGTGVIVSGAPSSGIASASQSAGGSPGVSVTGHGGQAAFSPNSPFSSGQNASPLGNSPLSVEGGALNSGSPGVSSLPPNAVITAIPVPESSSFELAAGSAAPPEDGFYWRKYGQKAAKGAPFPRAYYRCAVPGCPAKKTVEKAGDGGSLEVIYKEDHNHGRETVPGRRAPAANGQLIQRVVVTEDMGGFSHGETFALPAPAVSAAAAGGAQGGPQGGLQGGPQGVPQGAVAATGGGASAGEAGAGGQAPGETSAQAAARAPATVPGYGQNQSALVHPAPLHAHYQQQASAANAPRLSRQGTPPPARCPTPPRASPPPPATSAAPPSSPSPLSPPDLSFLSVLSEAELESLTAAISEDPEAAAQAVLATVASAAGGPHPHSHSLLSAGPPSAGAAAVSAAGGPAPAAASVASAAAGGDTTAVPAAPTTALPPAPPSPAAAGFSSSVAAAFSSATASDNRGMRGLTPPPHPLALLPQHRSSPSPVAAGSSSSPLPLKRHSTPPPTPAGAASSLSAALGMSRRSSALQQAMPHHDSSSSQQHPFSKSPPERPSLGSHIKSVSFSEAALGASHSSTAFAAAAAVAAASAFAHNKSHSFSGVGPGSSPYIQSHAGSASHSALSYPHSHSLPPVRLGPTSPGSPESSSGSGRGKRRVSTDDFPPIDESAPLPMETCNDAPLGGEDDFWSSLLVEGAVGGMGEAEEAGGSKRRRGAEAADVAPRHSSQQLQPPSIDNSTDLPTAAAAAAGAGAPGRATSGVGVEPSQQEAHSAVERLRQSLEALQHRAGRPQ